MPDRICSVEGCGRPHQAKGLCATHYRRRKNGQDLSTPIRQKESGERICKVDGCGRPRVHGGDSDHCPMHRMRVKRHGDAGGGERKRAPFGEPAWNALEYRRRVSRLYKYGLTPEEFDAIAARQGDRCAICRSKSPKSARNGTWCVDHDHVTGQVRGLLCNLCNRAVGMFQDDPKILRAAARYVERHRQMELFSGRAG